MKVAADALAALFTAVKQPRRTPITATTPTAAPIEISARVVREAAIAAYPPQTRRGADQNGGTRQEDCQRTPAGEGPETVDQADRGQVTKCPRYGYRRHLTGCQPQPAYTQGPGQEGEYGEEYGPAGKYIRKNRTLRVRPKRHGEESIQSLIYTLAGKGLVGENSIFPEADTEPNCTRTFKYSQTHYYQPKRRSRVAGV